MKSRWNEREASQAIEDWQTPYGSDFALRLYSARLLGGDAALVLHGGGNVSVKVSHHDILSECVEAICVKASGHDLSLLDPKGLPALDLVSLRRMRALASLGDEAMFNEIRRSLFDASAPTPSIETLVHAFMPAAFVDHSHADAVLVLTNQPDGEKHVRDALGADERLAILPYVTPGFELAKAVSDICESRPDVDAIVLLQHGLITFADQAKRSYERHIAIVDACERYAASRIAGRQPTVSFRSSESPAALAARVGPMLRGILAGRVSDEDQPYRRQILEWRASDDILSVVNSAEAVSLCESGPLTADHLIRTKPWPMYVDKPRWDDEAALRVQLSDAARRFSNRYGSYVSRYGAGDDVDFLPKVVLLPGAGIICRGDTKRDACIAADISEHTRAAKLRAHWIGEYRSLTEDHLFAMEYRGIQRAKLGANSREPMAGQVVVISGGAGAIGAAVAERCALAGAHVVVCDLHREAIDRVDALIASRCGPTRAVGVVMDVTDERSVRDGFDEICRTYGGVDCLVPNAGIAHVSPVDEMELADFRRVMEVNATGYLLFMREGIRVMKSQGTGGNIVINASKNVFAPGKDFAAYSASKAAGHQLGKVAAIELAPFGIRVNMINADAVFAHEDIASGLWEHVGPGRAKSRDMREADLPEYYRRRNLLKAQVRGYHVGNAVVFFASNVTPTTGATLPVDGGIVEAFPR